MKIKFCGLRRIEDIEYFNRNKVDYAGFVFAESKRKISKEEEIGLIEYLDRFKVKVVGVFADNSLDYILDIALDKNINFDIIQLHGREGEDFITELRKAFKGEIWKAMPETEENIRDFNKWSADKILIDSLQGGGSGEVADWSLIKKYKGDFKKDFLLAGGLNVGNIVEGMEETKPLAVDISSGIEKNGFKDEKLMKEIIRKVREYEK